MSHCPEGGVTKFDVSSQKAVDCDYKMGLIVFSALIRGFLGLKRVPCPEAEGAPRLSPFDALTLAQGGKAPENAVEFLRFRSSETETMSLVHVRTETWPITLFFRRS
jgi:hypothetical protein